MAKRLELAGERFGRLTVVEKANKTGYWICKCDCGNTTRPIRGADLRNGSTKSCGCLMRDRIKETNSKHGEGHSRLYAVWINMKERCYNTNRAEHKHYGGRGITVCDEWLHDFATFREWAMATGYNPNAKRGECTLDRIDVNGNYCPENCRWVTQKNQCNNWRKNILIEINGKAQTLKQWADESGLDESKIRYRYHHGYKGQDLLKKGRVRKNMESINGKCWHD